MVYINYIINVKFILCLFLNIKRVNLRYKTQDILICANNFTKRSFELEKEANDMEIEINSLNKVYILF